ncbi:DNA methyltransferase [Roseicyclus mahoneyensis]|uniref:site-specific DNA-methyltransferase (adenine-specific) n=1 Tax=Roseicyclus mahoneyensis TaxID=164332 RepID=A0A316G772_9RHOB|nr:DNA methyltransferase [Roseicyclus mahoneyensis]PWK56764.1 DNA methylase [Roseicyclus mahoneyensis]
MTEQMKMDGGKSGGPVECLGLTFPSDDARREHFSKLLAEKLQDPVFRAQEGFPDGSDEAILAMSDPPYFTACPNPWLEEYVSHYGSPYKSSDEYKKEPFASDVKEGKNAPVYNAHSYHTKVPHKAVMRYILHYTQPGDVVLDGFCGTGMTGVAAQFCGDRREIESLGYRVDDEGVIFEKQDQIGQSGWVPFSKIGRRFCVLNDLSAAASFIAHGFNTPVDIFDFEERSKRILNSARSRFGWMYQTLHMPNPDAVIEATKIIKADDNPNLKDFGTVGWVNFVIWSDVFICSVCQEEINYWNSAVNRDKGVVEDTFNCPNCNAELTKRKLDRAWTTYFDQGLSREHRQIKQVPVALNYSVGRKRYEKQLDEVDLAIFEKSTNNAPSEWYPVTPLMKGDKTGEPLRIGVTHAHHFYTGRTLSVLAYLRESIFQELHDCPALGLWFTSSMAWTNRLNRLLASNYFGGGGGVIGQTLQGTLYISSISVETNPLERFGLRIKSVPFTAPRKDAIVSNGSATKLSVPDNSLDYLFIDPPFGANIMYSELNFLWESWLQVTTNQLHEAIENKTQRKSVDDYRALMTDCFKEAYRVLKPGRWMTIEFSNTKASVWNSIQTSLQEAGFVVANVSVLEKSHKGFKAVTTTTAVKQDLVISAYKPNGGLEERISESGGGEDSAWDFARSHLGYLPVVKSAAGILDFIPEREPRIIFDRMVAWFVRHSLPVPVSSQEFQEGLRQRFVERDGMIFLPEQVSGYDKARSQSAQAPQMELFISDERSAIDWLSDFLKKRPSTYQELHPEFMSQLGAGWKKHETRPELASLLEDNFLQYEGKGDVPSQIHSYLSTNFKDLRGIAKEDSRLKNKAADRWYVPDPNKAKDLEQKRERSLLKEFEAYKTATKRQLKESRLEVLRAGFKTAWAAKDYKTIIGIARKLPDETLQGDEKLLLWYDQALTRTEADA